MEEHVETDHLKDAPPCKRTKTDEIREDRIKNDIVEADVKDVQATAVQKDESVKRNQFYLSENDVGIEEYVCKLPGIGGIIKQRYSDFLVREIDRRGKIVKLLSIGYTGEEKKEEMEEDNQGFQDGAECPISEDDRLKLNEFLSKSGQKDAKEMFILLTADNDKEHRKLVHNFIKKNHTILDTETVENENGDKMVKVFYRKPNQKSRRGGRNKSQQGNEQRYCHFVMYKENRDTMNAISLIADLLHVKPSLLTYSGTKDKRAITTQQVCANRIDPKRLSSINKLVKNIAVGSFEYQNSVLKLGDLKGNHFSLVLRNISANATAASVSHIIESLKVNGYINYFGMQRFGSGSVPTFEVGKAVLSSDWENVIRLILRPRFEEDKVTYAAKMHWLATKDSKAALEMLKKRRCIEGLVLEALAKQGEKSFYNAFQKIARNTRLMYLHSYQSYIWNKVVSKRIQLFGIEPKVGDLVLLPKSENCESEEEVESMTRCQVKEITEEDLATRKYAITDVVMPLPGYDITYPGFGAKEWYSEILAADGFDIDKMRHEIKEYSLSGAYRYIIVKPENVSWSITSYDDYCAPLLQSDLDVIQGKEPPVTLATGKYKALILEFSLPTSSYATMAIREITKMDTSTHKNIELNSE